MEDSFIVDLYWRRDEQAIAETERKYGGACEGIARRFLPAAEDAEEIVQDAYLSLWNTIPPQRPEHFAAYLFRTVRNAAFSRFRADSAVRRPPRSTSSPSASRGGTMWSRSLRHGSFLMR